MSDSETEVLARAEATVRERLKTDSTGHDWYHISRVVRLAAEIGEAEHADLFVVRLAALLHDVDDYKLAPPGGNPDQLPLATAFLNELKVGADLAAHVREIIVCMSYKGFGVATPMRTIEGMVVQDADRLDAIGAIGIARAFAYGGAKGRALYDPGVSPVRHQSFEEYKRAEGPTINHFYEKLLLLKDQMNTSTARRIADSRHEFLIEFVRRFRTEWDGGDY